uniref:Uncharacterized protein n=1 Tax=Daphnia magna TaxID=35525 RepID=A0A0P6HQ62_9CRUS
MAGGGWRRRWGREECKEGLSVFNRYISLEALPRPCQPFTFVREVKEGGNRGESKTN